LARLARAGGGRAARVKLALFLEQPAELIV
jgi:hypothetical protein